MQRRVVVAVIGIMLAWLAISAYDGTGVTGLLSASDQESDEGYFALGQDTMIVVKPGSALHAWLRNHKGQRIKITLEPDSDSD